MPATVGGYELVQRLAVGGMAEVFLARRPGPDGFEKRVALKRILPHLAKQSDFVSMFLDEAKLAAALDHPHIVHIYDFGTDGDAYFLAMEYVCGEDLTAIVRRANEKKQRLPFADVATILVAACEALHHAHEQGIVHRDVTPANLLVSYDGNVKLADFGIAKSQAAAHRNETNAGTLKGKIAYMSPEQARAKPLDRRSDLFSLGIVAWELITGKRLFHRRNELDMLRAVQMCDVPPLSTVRPDVPPALAAAIETALAPNVDDRWDDAAEMAQALLAWLAAAGETPSKLRLGATMASLFGADAAEKRLAAVTSTAEATAQHALPAIDGTPTPAGFSPLHPERWIPQIAMHLHLPPPRLPGWRFVAPLFAILLSMGGLLFGLHSPHARRALTAGVALPAPIAATPPPIATTPPSIATTPPPIAPPALAKKPTPPKKPATKHNHARRTRSGL